MNNFYTSSRQYGNQILVRGIKDGKRFISKEKFSPTMYQTSDKKTTKYHSLSGEPLQAIKFDSVSAGKDYLKKYADVHNFKIYGNDKFHFQWISELYKGTIEYDPSLIKTQTIDIETTVNYGRPDYFNPIEEVTLISCKDRVTKAVMTFGCWDYIVSRPEVTYVKCDNEADLFMKFIEWVESDYPDIFTGWNTDDFDIPYLLERMLRVIGEHHTKRISPFGIIRSREYELQGEKKLSYEIFGIASLDYLELYKKFTYTKQESYKLDFIGEVELKMNKLENPYPSFKEWYEKDPQMFTDYNIVDTDIVDGLEGKLKLIELAISLAFMAKINFDDVYSPVKMWDTIIYNHLLDQGKIVPHKNSVSEFGKSIEGAFVKEPIPGLYRFIASFDLASLYPHIIMALNMSPETISDQMIDTCVEELLNGDRSKITDGFSLAPNGSQYDMSTKGFLPELMFFYYNQRKVEKKKMIAMKKELEETRSTLSSEQIRILENKIATSNSLQMALKIALNSAYGALAQKSFRFYDTRIAEGITMGGQLIIQNAERAANVLVRKIMGTNKDYVIACDTDSAYLNLEDFIEKFCSGKTLDQKLDFMTKACDSKFQDALNAACDKLAQSMNWNDKFINFKREAICSVGFWTGKKMYALLVHDNEGVKYETPDLKVMGLSLVRSSTPNVVKDPLRNCVMQILTGDEKHLQRYVAEQEAAYMLLTPEQIAFPRGVNNMAKYSSKANIYGDKCPVAVRASLLHNHLVETKKLESLYDPIREGMKVKFVYLKEPNTLRENVIGFTDKMPKEFDLHKYVDYDTMWEKSFISALSKLTDAVGWNYKEVNTLDSLFD